MKMKRLLLLLIVLTLEHSGQGFQMFQSRIPNGDKVPNPCNPPEIWPGVGHLNTQGGGDRNAFGLDFHANGQEWTEILCLEDSDGDGLTNGYELGDPHCLWQPGSTPPRTTNITHPGICEPVVAKGCRENAMASRRYATQELWLTDVCPKAQFVCAGVTFNRTEDVKEVDFRLPVLPVHAKDTTYTCIVLDFPDSSKDYHIFSFKAIIDNADIVHHILLFGVPDDTPKTGAFECGMIDNPNVVGGWTLGVTGACLHHTIGFRAGRTGFKKLLLQVHWNNPLKRENMTDSSGLRVYYTSKLRQYDASMFVIGQYFIEIEAGSPNTVVSAACSQRCTEKLLTGDIMLFGGGSHMHLLGKSSTINQYRGGQLIRTLFYNPFYDFNYPIFLVFEEPIIMRPGDVLTIDCHYSATDKNTTTYYGMSTSDEMCFGYLAYAPMQAAPAGAFCTAYKNLLPCDNSTYRECNLSALDRFFPKVFPTTKLYRSVMKCCKV